MTFVPHAENNLVKAMDSLQSHALYSIIRIFLAAAPCIQLCELAKASDTKPGASPGALCPQGLSPIFFRRVLPDILARVCGFGRGNIICLMIQTSNTNMGAAVPGMKAFCSNLLSNVLIINEGCDYYF